MQFCKIERAQHDLRADLLIPLLSAVLMRYFADLQVSIPVKLHFLTVDAVEEMRNDVLGGLLVVVIGVLELIDEADLSDVVAASLPQGQRLELADLYDFLNGLFSGNDVGLHFIGFLELRFAVEKGRVVRVEAHHLRSHWETEAYVFQLSRPQF